MSGVEDDEDGNRRVSFEGRELAVVVVVVVVEWSKLRQTRDFRSGFSLHAPLI